MRGRELVTPSYWIVQKGGVLLFVENTPATNVPEKFLVTFLLNKLALEGVVNLMKEIIPNSICFEIPLENNDYMKLTIDLLIDDSDYNAIEIKQLLDLAVTRYIKLLE